MVSVLLLAATGCAAASDDVGSEDEDLTTVAAGVDTNGTTLDIAHAQSLGIGFVGRYISFDGVHPALTLQEAQGYQTAGMPLVAIWEIDQKRAFSQPSIAGQRALGASDGQAADTALTAAGGAGNPIYFTIDFDVDEHVWRTALKDVQTGNEIEIGDLVLAYFQGIDNAIGSGRAGAYGTYTVLHALFDATHISFGWQQTFLKHKNDPREGRAQIRQYNITADQTGWGVSGAGALDLDRAVHGNFGQWW